MKTDSKSIKNPQIKFTFITSKQKLEIEAFIKSEQLKYFGQMAVNPYIEFDLIKQMIEQNQFKILIKNETMLKIKVGPVQLQLQTKSKKQLLLLQKQLKQLTQQKAAIQTKAQKLLSDCEKEKKFLGLNPTINSGQKIKWSPVLKSDKNDIFKQFTTKNISSCLNEFTLTDIGFSKYVKTKQTWAIGCLAEDNSYKFQMYIGLCLRKNLHDINFSHSMQNKELKLGHGMYVIKSDGYGFSHSNPKDNVSFINFSFGKGDVIFVEYDPIECKLRFRKNKYDSNKFEMTLPQPPQDDAYHPCVGLAWKGISAELIVPGLPLS